jgi:hypothetical protein
MASASIPIMLTRIADRLLMALSPEEGKAWAARLDDAIGPGKDLAAVPWRFLHWLVTGSGLPDLDEPIIKEPVDACAAILCARSAGKSVCPDAAADAVHAVRSAAFSAALQGFSEATGYCAALAAEAVILESTYANAAAAKAVDAIEAAEWAVPSGSEPALYSKLAQKLVELVEQANGAAPCTISPVSTELRPPKPDIDQLEAARRALLDYLYSVTGVDGEADPNTLRHAITEAGDRLAEVALFLRKTRKGEPGPAKANDHLSGHNALLRSRGRTGIRPRAADDFPAIRARIEELRREHARHRVRHPDHGA